MDIRRNELKKSQSLAKKRGKEQMPNGILKNDNPDSILNSNSRNAASVNVSLTSPRNQKTRNKSRSRERAKSSDSKEKPKKGPDRRLGGNDFIRRVSTRSEDENMIDILLSGTAATLVIQTPKKIYIGWIGGDSHAAM